jgi:hypothetical protein
MGYVPIHGAACLSEKSRSTPFCSIPQSRWNTSSDRAKKLTLDDLKGGSLIDHRAVYVVTDLRDIMVAANDILAQIICRENKVSSIEASEGCETARHCV